jgi:hypothetical protein
MSSGISSPRLSASGSRYFIWTSFAGSSSFTPKDESSFSSASSGDSPPESWVR